MSCKRVVVTGSSSSGDTTTVSWPFPPKPVDPGAGRPITVRVADTTAGTVTVDWLSSTISYLEGYVLTIIEGTSGLTNFAPPRRRCGHHHGQIRGRLAQAVQRHRDAL